MPVSERESGSADGSVPRAGRARVRTAARRSGHTRRGFQHERRWRRCRSVMANGTHVHRSDGDRGGHQQDLGIQDPSVDVCTTASTLTLPGGPRQGAPEGRAHGAPRQPGMGRDDARQRPRRRPGQGAGDLRHVRPRQRPDRRRRDRAGRVPPHRRGPRRAHLGRGARRRRQRLSASRSRAEALVSRGRGTLRPPR